MDRQVTVPYYEDDTATLYVGDCFDVLERLDADSVDCIITSPPYAMQRASTYGGIPEADYPAWAVDLFEKFARVLKTDGSVLWNISPHVRGGQLADYTLRMRLALRGAGWFEHDELVWVKPDKMPTGKPTWPVRAWESIHWFSRTPDPWVDAKACGNEITPELRERAAALPNAFRGRDARLGWDHLGSGYGRMGERSRAKNWLQVAVRAIPNDVDHPAPFPHQLAEWLVQMFARPGGVVLDPFSGSASTGLAANKHGRRYIGIDLDPAYHDLALRTRLRQPGLDLEGITA
ncbi:MAG TPA: site-specific DNA-methyltransferase [Microthrixaceae bacterium]|nr:site-specific DNA-methyltransferase [Microthrixaceae bacterium]